MRRIAMIGACLALLLGLNAGSAEEILWRPAGPNPPAQTSATVPIVTLGRAVPIITPGRPQPIEPIATSSIGEPTPPSKDALPAGYCGPSSLCLGIPNVLVRGQMADSPPGPPAPGPFGGAPAAAPGPPPGPGPAGGGDDAYNCGVDNMGKPGTVWERFCDGFKHCFDDIKGGVSGAFQEGRGRKMFQSDTEFEEFSSPVSDPFFFLDPRSLTEIKPLLIWQGTRSSNPIYAGGSNFFFGLQGSVALTEHISFKFSELGITWSNPENPDHVPGFSSAAGLSELHLGPQITFYRNPQTKTLAAAGLTFELPVGSGRVFQNTGGVGFVPYVSFGQNFLGSTWGSFNFLNTTGWAGGAERSGFFFSNFHLDYNVKNLDRFFPLVEINWQAYTNSGTVRDVGFEGGDLFNFGSKYVAGENELLLNLGGRVKINDFWQVGAAVGFGLLHGGDHMDGVRLMVDMIFRY